jgi:hypothetical protein
MQDWELDSTADALGVPQKESNAGSTPTPTSKGQPHFYDLQHSTIATADDFDSPKLQRAAPVVLDVG